MDDFEFLLPDDEPILTVDHEGSDDNGHVPQFHHLVKIPTHQLPKTNVPNRPAHATMGGSIRDLVASRRSWGIPKLNLSSAAPQTPMLSSQQQPVEPPPLVAGSREGSHDSAQPPQEKYMWVPSRRAPVLWSDDETQQFYDGIAQFGTSLSSIAVLFPGRTREDISLKYRQEQMKRPEKLRQALLTQNQRPIDVVKFKECKKKCDELKAEPVRVLNADEQEALNHLLGALEQQPQQPPAATVKIAVVKDDLDGPHFPPVVPEFAPQSSDFQFDDDDAPITSIYSTKNIKRARSPHSASPKEAKGKRKPAAASPLPKPHNALATSSAPATQVAPLVMAPPAEVDFEFDEEQQPFMTFEQAAGLALPDDDDGDLTFDQPYPGAANDGDDELQYL